MSRAARPSRAEQYQAELKRGRWDQFPKLMAGFAVFATGISLMIQAGLGLDPWSAFHMGLSLTLPISYGVASASVVSPTLPKK